MNRTYDELVRLRTFDERFEYLQLKGIVGYDTFGFDRYLNQKFYRSKEWKQLRNNIIVRDNGCDLGCEDRPIFGKIIVHHMNPITPDKIDDFEYILDPDSMICVSQETHNAIHYGNEIPGSRDFEERSPGDTLLWRRRL